MFPPPGPSSSEPCAARIRGAGKILFASILIFAVMTSIGVILSWKVSTNQGARDRVKRETADSTLRNGRHAEHLQPSLPAGEAALDQAGNENHP